MTEKRAYHHGALRPALIAAARAILGEHGTAGLTLRECARRAGVSNAAPQHHFADKTALLTAVAAAGFRDLTASMDAYGHAAGRDPRTRLREVGVGYIAFAVEHPETFRLIFGQSRLYTNDPEYSEAAGAAFDRLADAVVAASGINDRADTQAEQRMKHAWSVVHGYAMLWLGGALANTLHVPSDPTAVLKDARRFLVDAAPLDASG